jgi:hypothetical protein
LTGHTSLPVRAVLLRAAQNGTFRGQVGAAVMHVLAAKQAYGLLPCSG